MKTTESFNVQLWVGLRSGYSDKVHSIDEVRAICWEHINKVKDCITITPTEFWYVDGWESGVVIGWINYPRFPRNKEEIVGGALALAKILKDALNQNRVTITTPNESIMIGDE